VLESAGEIFVATAYESGLLERHDEQFASIPERAILRFTF
jgi:hypothetical protein